MPPKRPCDSTVPFIVYTFVSTWSDLHTHETQDGAEATDLWTEG